MGKILMNLSSDFMTSDSVGTDDFYIKFRSPVAFGSADYEIALISYNLYNTNPNISATLYNNATFSYSPDGGVTFKVITIPDGNYNVGAIQAEVSKQILANGDNPADLQIVANLSTLHITIILMGGYQINLGTGSQFYLLLGFSAAQVAAPITVTTTAANIADINRGVNNVYLHLDIVNSQGSYDSAVGSDIISDLSFTGKPPGSNVFVAKPFAIWIPMKKIQYLEQVHVRISDQMNRRYSLLNQPLNIQLYFRPIKEETVRKQFEDFTTGIKDAFDPKKMKK